MTGAGTNCPCLVYMVERVPGAGCQGLQLSQLHYLMALRYLHEEELRTGDIG